MPTKKTILIDMDGVLADLVPTWLAAYEDAGGEHLSTDQIRKYNFEDIVAHPALFHEQLDAKRLFRELKAFGSVSLFQELCQDNEVFIVSYVHPSSTYGHRDKIGWISSVFPWFNLKRVCLLEPKYLVRGDILIEDSPENIDLWTEANPKGIAICIKAAYNEDWFPRNSTRVLRANDIDHATRMIRRFI